MCGIAGLLRAGGDAGPEDRRRVQRMSGLLATRGPDGAGLQVAGPAVLAHRRLSIIDLSDAASQPMANEDGTLWLVYNGEIYNFAELRQDLLARGHRFRSRADSEVLVHGYEAWGPEGLVSRLRGMFAFALYDQVRRTLVLGRDRLGIKPLYYAERPDGLAFASEVRALVTAPGVRADEDAEAVAGYLLLGAVPEPRTVARGVRCLPPGHLLVATPGASRLVRYWELGSPEPDRRPPGGTTLAEDVGATLQDAVARHLVSDVPLGIFLSGGVDSAGLVALARRAGSSRLHTLTVAFDEPGFSEAAPARQVADALQAEHHEILVTEADFRLERDRFLEAIDQPTHDGVNTYFVARAARKAGLTVALSGAGGDEVFWGYGHHALLAGEGRPLARLAALPRLLRAPVATSAWALGALRGRESWRRLRLLAGPAGPAQLYAAVRGFFAPEQVSRLTGLPVARLQALVEELLAGPGVAGTADGGAVEVNRLEFRRYLHDQLLRDTDVFGMAHSLEIRVPFLDHQVVERLWRVPPARKLRAGRNKPLLAEAVGHPAVTARSAVPKRGFSFPLERWLRRQADELEPLAVERSGLDRAAVRRAWRAFRGGRLHWSRAWALMTLGAAATRRPAA